MKNLVVVESPTKARTLSRFLGSGFRTEASLGHLRDLPEKKLGVDIEHDFTPKWVLAKGKRKKVTELKKIAKKAKKLYLATDPDREGEAIAYHVAQILRKPKNGALRIVFHEITKEAIEKALKNPREVDLALVDAQKARRILDRLVGYKLSPLLWRKVQRGLSAGRVQSVAVRLIVEREREIKAFVPEEYWVIEAELKKRKTKDKRKTEFLAKLIKKDGKKIEIKNKNETDKLLSVLKKAIYTVSNIEKKEVRKAPFPPFITSTLQQAAGNLLRFSTKKTMMLAQGLYEQGFITYHRTDSVNLAREAIDRARTYIKKEYGKKYLPEKSRIFKTKSKVAQEAHEAIRPTDIGAKEAGIGMQLGRDAGKLYGLIWKRFMACQMENQVLDETKVGIEANSKFIFQAVGKVEKFDGWKKVYQRAEAEKKKAEEQLPLLSVAEVLTLIKLIPTQKFTQSPPRYSEASLVRALEERGIGRPSTYAPIISTIQDRQYVTREEGKLKPTELGFVVNDFLIKYFSKIMDYSFTAQMEDDLDEIADGKREWIPLVEEFYQPFSEKLIKVSKRAQKVKVEEELDEKCPQCGAPLVVKFGRYGKFVSCSKFPKCNFKRSYVEKTGQKCPECGGDVIIKKTKKGKIFYGCSNYPKCTWASWQKPKEQGK
jgi:DNA topoisomerase-1